MTQIPILVTGGAGYIGSQTCKLLSRSGFTPVTIDNLSTGHRDNVRFGPFVYGDIRDRALLDRTLAEWRPGAVIHFAACASVAESVAAPDHYYSNNVIGLITLLDALKAAGIGKIVFSSSCATYGIPDLLPITETCEQRPINPYGETKLIGERVLRDYGNAFAIRHVCLRYFNACGADLEGELHENHDPETHLIPRALMAAAGRIPHLDIFGDDYDTPDGTCIRDYVHVEDLADAHVRALVWMGAPGASLRVNVGTGRGLSIREILAGIHRICGWDTPIRIAARRPGDPACLIADPALAFETLGFKPRHSDIDTIISSAAAHFLPAGAALGRH